MNVITLTHADYDEFLRTGFIFARQINPPITVGTDETWARMPAAVVAISALTASAAAKIDNERNRHQATAADMPAIERAQIPLSPVYVRGTERHRTMLAVKAGLDKLHSDHRAYMESRPKPAIRGLLTIAGTSPHCWGA